MAGPVFVFRAVLEEIKAMRQLADAGHFLADVSYDRLQRFQEEVERVKTQGRHGNAWRVEISKDYPIRTRPSQGDYQPNKDETRPVLGELSTCWHISPIGIRKRRSGFKEFVVDTTAGAASTRASIRQASDEHGDREELAIWHSDIRSTGGPGCFYHFQVLGESDDLPFPDFLGIPRFPDPFTTPMAILEFLLCELFPVDWAKHLSTGALSAGDWRETQKQRWKARLDAQKMAVLNTNSSPWLAVRKWSPC